MKTREELIEAARRDIADAERCQALHITPATGTILRRLREVTNALAVLEKATEPTDDEREAQGWREAELYASADGDARDDFMTGWRTADRLRRTVQGPENSAQNSDDERSVIESIKLAGHLATQVMVFQGDSYPVKAIPYTSFLQILDGFRRPEVPEPSGDWDRVHDRPADIFTPPEDRIVRPSPEPKGEPSDAQVDAAMDTFYGKEDAAIAHPFREDMRAALRAAALVNPENPEQPV